MAIISDWVKTYNTSPTPITAGSATPTGSTTTPQANPQDKNPYTWAYETINPDIGVNEGMYSKENKINAIKNLGYSTSWKTGFSWEDLNNGWVFTRGTDWALQIDETKLGNYWFKKNTTPTLEENAITQTNTNTASTIEAEKTNQAILRQNQTLIEEEKARQLESAQAIQDMSTQKAETEKANAEAIQAQTEAESQRKLGVSQDILNTQIQFETDEAKANISAVEADAAARTNAAEAEMKAQNEAAAMTAQKMGFGTSTISNINATLTQWLLNLNALKTSTALAVADAKQKANEIETNHRFKVEKLVSDANAEIISSRSKLNEQIATIQGNLINSAKEKENAISKAIEDYRTNKETTTAKLTNSIKAQNDYTQTQSDRVMKITEEAQAKKLVELQAFMASGKWYTASAQTQYDMSKAAWISSSQAMGMVQTAITKGIQNAIGTIGKTYGLSMSDVNPQVVANANQLVAGALKNGFNMEDAIMQGVRYIQNNDETFKRIKGMGVKEAELNLKSKEVAIANSKKALASQWVAKSNISSVTVDNWKDNNTWKIVPFVTTKLKDWTVIIKDTQWNNAPEWAWAKASTMSTQEDSEWD